MNRPHPFHPNDRFENNEFVIEFTKGNIWRKFSDRYALAGYIHKDSGYRRMKVNGKPVQCHRFIVEKFIGQPLDDTVEIDHVNHIKHDNRIANLRVVTREQNQQHKTGAQRNSRSGMLGVNYNRFHDKWHASLFRGGKKLHLGYHDTAREAAIARNERVMELNAEGHMYTLTDITQNSSVS